MSRNLINKKLQRRRQFKSCSYPTHGGSDSQRQAMELAIKLVEKGKTEIQENKYEKL